MKVKELQDRVIFIGTEVAAKHASIRSTIAPPCTPMDFAVLVQFLSCDVMLVVASCEIKRDRPLCCDLQAHIGKNVVAQAAFFACGLVLPSLVDACGQVWEGFANVSAAIVVSKEGAHSAMLLDLAVPSLGDDWDLQGRSVAADDVPDIAPAALLHVLRTGLQRALDLPSPGSAPPQACLLGKLDLDVHLPRLRLLASPSLNWGDTRSSQGLLLRGRATMDALRNWAAAREFATFYTATDSTADEDQDIVLKLAGRAYRHRALPHVAAFSFQLLKHNMFPVLLVVGDMRNVIVTAMVEVKGRAARVEDLRDSSAVDSVVSTLEQLAQHTLVHHDVRLGNLWCDESRRVGLLDWDSLATCAVAPTRGKLDLGAGSLRAPAKRSDCLSWAIWQLALLAWSAKGGTADQEHQLLLRGLLRRSGGSKLCLAALELELLGRQSAITDFAALKAESLVPSPVSAISPDRFKELISQVDERDVAAKFRARAATEAMETMDVHDDEADGWHT